MSRTSALLRSAKEGLRGARAGVRPYIAPVWRRLFRNTEFLAITGSHGKTTAWLLLVNILRCAGWTGDYRGRNDPPGVLKSILKGNPWRDRFFVQEVSGHQPGAIAESLAVLRPRVGIVTAVGGDHRKAFGGSLDAIAVEKGSLVRLLPHDGLAVLNADDPRVANMAAGAPCRVVRFGSSDGVDLWLISAQSRWPDRLTLEVEYKGERFNVRTRLVGTHWAVSTMAALLTALELGIPRSDCLAAIEAMSPVYSRMSVHPSPHGGWYVLDAKSSFFGIERCLDFLREASSAPRRTVLFGSISDHPGKDRSYYTKAARMALETADRVIFTGRNAQSVRRLAGEFADRLFVAEYPAEVLRLLESDAVPGEIIYVKYAKVDRLDRVLMGGDSRTKQETTGHPPLSPTK